MTGTGDPPAPATSHVHRYRCGLAWEGSTGAGYEQYQRVHRWWIRLPDGTRVSPTDEMSNDPAFLGDAAFANPEHLLLMAAASCQLFSFLAVAARARIDVVAYADDATAEMPESNKPMRLTTIVLRPRITLAGSAYDDAGGASRGSADGPAPTDARLQRLIEIAHKECFIANSVRPEITVEPTFARR